jgi:hypothetical protein
LLDDDAQPFVEPFVPAAEPEGFPQRFAEPEGFPPLRTEKPLSQMTDAELD